MKCPHCSNNIGFLYLKLKRPFKCPICKQKFVLVLKEISDTFMWLDIIISGAVLSILPIPENGVFSWLIPVVFVLLIGFFTIILFTHIEPDEDHE